MRRHFAVLANSLLNCRFKHLESLKMARQTLYKIFYSFHAHFWYMTAWMTSCSSCLLILPLNHRFKLLYSLYVKTIEIEVVQDVGKSISFTSYLNVGIWCHVIHDVILLFLRILQLNRCFEHLTWFFEEAHHKQSCLWLSGKHFEWMPCLPAYK